MSTEIEYKYNEQKIIQELQEYVDTTYLAEDNNHYASGSIETTEYIIDQGHGFGFVLGNVIKYASRYGKKGGRNRKDLMKVLHYAIMAIHAHDLEETSGTDKEKESREPFSYEYTESDRPLKPWFKRRGVLDFKTDN